MQVVDILNEIGNNFAVSSDGIATALQTSASALMSAGNDLNKSVALVAAANKVIQDPSQVGAALRTIALRIRGTSVEVLEEMGEETDGVVESVSKLQEKVKAITGVDILEESGAYKDTYQILKELAEVWDDVGKTDPKGQAALLELLAGKNRSNALAAILGNLEDLDDAYKAALDAEGSAQKELDTYLNSIEGRIKKFTTALQTMWMNLIDSDVIKQVVDFGTGLIKILDKINQIPVVGPWISLSLIIGTFIGLLKGIPALLGKIGVLTNINAAAKKEEAKQTTVLSAAIKEENASRTANVAATNAETAAIKANTAAQIENNKAHAGEVFDVWDTSETLEKKLGDNIEDAGYGVVGEVDDLATSATKAANNIDDAAEAVDDLTDAGYGIVGVAETFDDLSDSGKATKKVVKEVAEEAIEGAVEAGVASTAAGAAAGAAGGKLAALGTSITTFFSSPLVMILAAAAAIGAVVVAVDYFTVSFKEAREQLEKTTQDLEDTREGLKSLNKEFETIDDTIKKLEEKGNLTFTEKQELDNLKAQREELEAILALEQQKEQRLMRQQAREAKQAFDKDADMNTSEQAVFKGYLPNGQRDYEIVEVEPKMKQLIGQYERSKIDSDKALQELLMAEEALADANADTTSPDRDQKLKAAQDVHKKTQKAYEDAKANADQIEQAIQDQLDKIEEMYGTLEWQSGAELEPWQKELNAMLTEIYALQDSGRIAIAETEKSWQAAFSRMNLQSPYQDVIKDLKSGDANLIQQLQNSIYRLDEDTQTWTGGLEQISNPRLKAFVQSLMDAGIISGFTTEEIQRVIDAYSGLNEQTEKQTVAGKKLERSQKRLEYYKKYKELRGYTKELRESRKKLSELDETTRKNINTTLIQMNTLAAEIDAYDILGETIEEAKKAFDEFEKAKNTDEERDRLEPLSEMFESIINGFHKGELGSETFKAAMEGLVPPSVYEDIDTLEGKLDAIWKYMDQDLNKYFSIKFDDKGLIEEVKVTTADIERFVGDAVTKGLMSKNEDGSFTVLETNFENFAKSIGLTESALYALFVQIDKLDADWLTGDGTSIFDSFNMDSESNLYRTITQLAELEDKFINGKISAKEYIEQYDKLQEQLAKNSDASLDDIFNYQKAADDVIKFSNQLEEAHKKLIA